MKRIIAFLLICLIPSVGLAEYTMAGFDSSDTYRTWTSNAFLSRMEDLTGVHFTYLQYTDKAQWTLYKASVSSSDPDLPDVFFKAQLTSAECIDLLDKSVIVDLAPYIEKDCPNLWSILNETPEYLSAITLPDGRIGALPSISEQPMQNCIWINKTWLDKLELEMPETIEEFTTVLRAFRDNDSNGNGKKDEIPLSFIGTFDLKFLGHTFGLIANDYNICCEDGKVVFVPLKDEFRDFVTWLNQLWSEGLLDSNGFSTSDSLRTISDSSTANVYGCIITTMVSNILPTDWLTDYAVLTPITYNGNQVYRSFVGNVMTGTFAVTTACENIDEVLQWVDRFYTEEVYRLGSAGLEGTDYVIDGDGTWRLTASAQNNNYFTGDVLISSGSAYPGLASKEFQTLYYDGVVKYISAEIDKVSIVAKRPFPYYSLNAEQASEIAPLQNKIAKIVDQAIAEWVVGEKPLTDNTFEQFEDQLQKSGLNEFLSFWQSILEMRYSK